MDIVMIIQIAEAVGRGYVTYQEVARKLRAGKRDELMAEINAILAQEPEDIGGEE